MHPQETAIYLPGIARRESSDDEMCQPLSTPCQTSYLFEHDSDKPDKQQMPQAATLPPVPTLANGSLMNRKKPAWKLGKQWIKQERCKDPGRSQITARDIMDNNLPDQLPDLQ